jgi:hypothetical protein
VKHQVPYVVKELVLDCGCADEVWVRPRESRLYLRVGLKTGCIVHGVVTIVAATEIDGNVPLIGEILAGLRAAVDCGGPE